MICLGKTSSVDDGIFGIRRKTHRPLALNAKLNPLIAGFYAIGLLYVDKTLLFSAVFATFTCLRRGRTVVSGSTQMIHSTGPIFTGP
jgi:hypothetical protein